MTIREIDVHELAALGEGAVVVDVRQPDEWQDGHIAHAVHVPLTAVPEQLEAFAGTLTYVVCRSGSRSAAACEFATQHGHEAVNVVGGMLAWQEAGYDVVAGG